MLETNSVTRVALSVTSQPSVLPKLCNAATPGIWPSLWKSGAVALVMGLMVMIL